MKDIDLAKLKAALERYRDVTGSKVVLLLDTTFSPPSQSAAEFSGASPFPTVVFTSLSKSVTGGRTTGGSLVANDTPLAQALLARAHVHLALLDTEMKNCQYSILGAMHGACEERVLAAHKNCIGAAKFFEAAVEKHSGRVRCASLFECLNV